MKYIFKQVDNISGRNAETTVEFDADYLPDILEHFEMFLRGSGFHPSGTLDFVNEDDCEEWHNEEFDTPQEKPVYPWNDTGAIWPFHLEPIKEEWNGVAPSVAMQWTADQLIKNAKQDYCPICGISLETMKNQKCWDPKCPKGQDAN